MQCAFLYGKQAPPFWGGAFYVGLAEWMIAPVLKTGGPRPRGFKSHTLRHAQHPDGD